MVRLISLVALCGLPSPLILADDWPGYGGRSGNFIAPPAESSPVGEWKRDLPNGTSQIISDGTRLYTQAALSRRGEKTAVELTLALDPRTGKTLWEESTPVKARDKQETFGGEPLQTQATPLVSNGLLFTVGFSGLLQTRNSASGKLIWSTDLVADHKATPVQFGFSASPIVFDGKLIVAVGGAAAAIAFNPADGKVLWTAEAAEPGYATPVVQTVDGRTIVVVLTRDKLLGIDPADGKTLWTYPLPSKNLTNVPTPIVRPNGELIVAGQGLGGTRLLKVSRSADGFAVSQVWHQAKVQFFYTNWAADASAVYGFPGNSGRRMTALNLADGKIRSQDLNLTDAHVVLIGSQALLCRGDGLLSLGTFTADGFDAVKRAKPVSGRCWTPPSVIGDVVLVRSNSELAAVKLRSLSTDFVAPPDRGVSALDAAFGGKK